MYAAVGIINYANLELIHLELHAKLGLVCFSYHI